MLPIMRAFLPAIFIALAAARTTIGSFLEERTVALPAHFFLTLTFCLAHPVSSLAQEAYLCTSSDYYDVRWVHSEFSPSPHKPVDERKEKFAVEISLATNPDGKTGVVGYEKTPVIREPGAPRQARLSRDEFGLAITWTIDAPPSTEAISVFPRHYDTNGSIFGTAVSIAHLHLSGTVRQLKCRRTR